MKLTNIVQMSALARKTGMRCMSSAFVNRLSADTIFAPATASGVAAAVAVVRISGPLALDALAKMSPVYARKRTSPRELFLTKLVRPGTEEVLDLGMAVYFHAPKSYTGEHSAEYYLHGGPAVVDSVMKGLSEIQGCRLAKPGEFTMRAFLNGKISLDEAESIRDLVESCTEEQRRRAVLGVQGVTSKLYKTWRAKLLTLQAHVEAGFDFNEEIVDPSKIINEKQKFSAQAKTLHAEMTRWLDTNVNGELVKTGIRSVIFGPVSAGKSSLLNYFTKKYTAIVSQSPGTTRDIIETKVDVAGNALVLADTAGLREATQEVEQIGIKLARERTKTSQLKLCVFDVSDPVSIDVAVIECKKVSNIIKKTNNRVVIIANKIDLLQGTSDEQIQKGASVALEVAKKADLADNALVVGVSLASGYNILELNTVVAKAAKEIISAGKSCEFTGIPSVSARQRSAIAQSVACLQAFLAEDDLVIASEHLREAAQAVGQASGDGDAHSEEILDIVFRDFCVGK